MLEASLTQAGLAELQRRREDHLRGRAPPVSFEDFWQWVVRTYGQDPRAATLQELRSLEPQTQGKLTAESWLAYSEEFMLRLARLEDAREEKVADWPLARVPESMRTGLLREELKLNRRRPLVRVSGVAGTPREQLLRIIAELLFDHPTASKPR